MSLAIRLFKLWINQSLLADWLTDWYSLIINEYWLIEWIINHHRMNYFTLASAMAAMAR